ncbi:hypothetical protein KS4_26910 [Poriferisphaera corsica]|uniref:Uncharacterized protein n=1 Tax=Poriferisphaera corsica TaxID=2528020 RepID=A0A517YWL6_9BACT|nr:hypothetical protein [Poriferisphaera corsica]QDU34620.1 hypothetical protein KS4_26910 [Poriferisphaera corsica]
MRSRTLRRLLLFVVPLLSCAPLLAAPQATLQTNQQFSIHMPEERLERIDRLEFPTSDIEQLLVFTPIIQKPQSDSLTEQQLSTSDMPTLTRTQTQQLIESMSDQKFGCRIFDFKTEKFQSVSRYRRGNKLRHKKLWSLFPDMPLPDYYLSAVKNALAWQLRADHQRLIRVDTPQTLRTFQSEAAQTTNDILIDDPVLPPNATHYIFSVYDSQDLFKPTLISRFELQTTLTNPQITFSNDSAFILTFENSKRLAMIELPQAPHIEQTNVSYDRISRGQNQVERLDWPEPAMTVVSFENAQPELLHQAESREKQPLKAEDIFQETAQSSVNQSVPNNLANDSVLSRFFSGQLPSRTVLTNTDSIAMASQTNLLEASVIVAESHQHVSYDPSTTYMRFTSLAPPFERIGIIDPKITTRRISTRNVKSVDLRSIHGRFLAATIEYMTPLHANKKQLIMLIDTQPISKRPEVIWVSDSQDEQVKVVTIDQTGRRVAFIRGNRIVLDHLKAYELVDVSDERVGDEKPVKKPRVTEPSDKDQPIDIHEDARRRGMLPVPTR